MAKIGTDPNIGKDTRFPNNDPTKGGRPLSFKTRYKEIYEQNDAVIWLPQSAVLERTKNGINEIGLPLQKSDQILAKLDRLIANGKEGISLNAIKFIWEQIDGKPRETVDITQFIEQPLFLDVSEDHSNTEITNTP